VDALQHQGEQRARRAESEQQSKFLFGLSSQGEVFVDDAALLCA
jgi:hypothetical protein